VKLLPPAKGAEITAATPEQWRIVLEGMVGTLRYGTAAYTAGKNMTYTIAGKTGTAQVFTVGQNEKLDNQNTVAERLRDHSWFIAFAPAEAPRIAVAVIVENGGFGSAVAAPIARKVMDTFLLDATGKLKVPLPEGATPFTLRPRGAPAQKPPAGGSASEEPSDSSEPSD
jgi:penicillin-binding protein 2